MERGTRPLAWLALRLASRKSTLECHCAEALQSALPTRTGQTRPAARNLRSYLRCNGSGRGTGLDHRKARGPLGGASIVAVLSRASGKSARVAHRRRRSQEVGNGIPTNRSGPQDPRRQRRSRSPAHGKLPAAIRPGCLGAGVRAHGGSSSWSHQVSAATGPDAERSRIGATSDDTFNGAGCLGSKVRRITARNTAICSGIFWQGNSRRSSQ